MSKSCSGCKFVFGYGEGYSDYTWMDTLITCALDKNPKLPKSECDDMDVDGVLERLGGRCDSYSLGPYITISPDGYKSDDFIDEQQRDAIVDSGAYLCLRDESD